MINSDIVLKQTVSKLNFVENPLSEALMMLETVTETNPALIVAGEIKLNTKKQQILTKLISARQQLPLAYVLKTINFYGFDFKINRHALIPRPESEVIVTLALNLIKKPTHVYDVGSGSGCLGLTLALKTPLVKHLTSLDICPKALKLAQDNAQSLKVKTPLTFHCQDLLKLTTDYFDPASVILANLPYLDTNLRSVFEKNCPQLKTEPQKALYGSNLHYYQHLFQICPNKSTIVCETLKISQPRLDKIARKWGLKLIQRDNLVSVYIK